MAGPDARRLDQILRIRKSRLQAAQRALEEATAIERQRRSIRDKTLIQLEEAKEREKDYFQTRFKNKGMIENFGAFFESVTTGKIQAKRALNRANTALTRMDQRHQRAEEDRNNAAREVMDRTRQVEAIEQVINIQRQHVETRRDLEEEDDLSELQFQRRPDAVS